MVVKSKATVCYNTDMIKLDNGKSFYMGRDFEERRYNHGDRIMVTMFTTYSDEVLWWEVDEKLNLLGETREEEHARTNPDITIKVTYPRNATMEFKWWVLSQVQEGMGI